MSAHFQPSAAKIAGNESNIAWSNHKTLWLSLDVLTLFLSVYLPPQRQIHIVKINTKRIILVISEWSAEINQKVVKNLYFVIREATNGQYYFVIKSNNNEVVATSETYLTKYSAEQTINSIKNGITKDSQVIDMTK